MDVKPCWATICPNCQCGFELSTTVRAKMSEDAKLGNKDTDIFCIKTSVTISNEPIVFCVVASVSRSIIPLEISFSRPEYKHTCPGCGRKFRWTIPNTNPSKECNSMLSYGLIKIEDCTALLTMIQKRRSYRGLCRLPDSTTCNVTVRVKNV